MMQKYKIVICKKFFVSAKTKKAILTGNKHSLANKKAT